MLQSLHVHNFALLEDAAIDFAPGFNVFTGETGAGKSILTDAFGAVLGARASASSVRSGTDAFWVQAVFDIAALPQLQAYLAEQDLADGDELFLKRQVNAAGKSRAHVNGIPVPLAVLKQIGAMLVDIHGQHENQALLDQHAPRVLTDAFGGTEAALARAKYEQNYAAYMKLQKRLAALRDNGSQREILLDRYDWEIKELTGAALRPGEEEALEAESRILQNAEKIIKAAGAAYDLLDGDNMTLALLARVKDHLASAGRYDARLQALAESADGAWIALEDCRQELSEYLASCDFNNERAAAVQERLDAIYRLHKKYGGSTEAALAYLEEARSKYRELAELEETIAAAERELAAATREL